MSTSVGIFALEGVRKLAGKYQGASWQQLQSGLVSFRGDLGSGLCIGGLDARPPTCGLGIEIHIGLGRCPGVWLSKRR